MKRLLTLTLATLSLGLVAPTAMAMTGNYAGDKTMQKPKADIVDTAIAAGSFKTLVAAVQAAGLESALRGDGPLTVFAPTDAAFAKLPAGTVESLLLPENKDKLAAILTYHVVAGKVKSKDLREGQVVTTLGGQTATVTLEGGAKIGGSSIVKADIYSSNGVIHVIDTVLLPAM